MSSQAYNRRLAQRVSLNRQILENKYWHLPVDDKGHENYMPVGRGDRSSDLCGKWVSYRICKDYEAHEGVVKNGVDCTDMMGIRNKHLFCNNASCPICFIKGWSVRRGRSITGRLDEAVERGFGDVEHMVVSVAPDDYGLSESVMRKKAHSALSVRGVFAYNIMFHGFRINRARGVLVWSPHYHVLGFIEGGYRCRDCERKWDCLKDCGGFDDRSWQQYAKDKFYVKVLAERKSVFGSAYYELNHSTLRIGIKRFHVYSWGGRLGNSTFKSKRAKPVAEDKCPICLGEMKKAVYVGKRHFAKDVGDVEYRAWFLVHRSEENDFLCYDEMYEGGGIRVGREMQRSRRYGFG